MKHLLLIIILLPFICFSQIKIDISQKSINDIKDDINYLNANIPSKGYTISKGTPENHRYDEEHTHLFNIGCPIVLIYKSQTKLITANYSGEFYFYDLPTGRLERNINFSKLGSEILKTNGLNKNSIITSLSCTDDEQYLIFQTYNFSGTNDKYKNYYVLDLNDVNLKVYSLYSFPKTEILNESKILTSTPKYLHEKALLKIQSLSKSRRKLKMSSRYDGIYFTATNYVPLKYIHLGDKTYYEAIDFFTNRSGRFIDNTSIADYSDFKSTISNNYLLNDIIQNNQGTFALFGTSYGSKSNASLVKIDELLNNVDELFEKSLLVINSFYKENIINKISNLIEYKKDKLYIKFENGNYYFVSPWLDQSIKCDMPNFIWSNSYDWNYYKNIEEINDLNLKSAILFNDVEKGEYKYFGWEENKLFVYTYKLNNISSFENPLEAQQLSLDKKLIDNIDFNLLLPKNTNSEITVETKPSSIVGETQCEVCAGTGFIPEKVRNGYIRSFQVNPITGELVKCFNCNGKGRYTLVTGNYEKKKFIQFGKWTLKNVNICNKNKIVIVFEANKRTFIQESRGGYITKGELSNNETIFYSFIVTNFGKVISRSETNLQSIEKCNEYYPIYNGD